MANPNKSPEVVHILTGNKERLLRYLGDFHTDKGQSPAQVCYILGSLEHPQQRSSAWMAFLEWSFSFHTGPVKRSSEGKNVLST